MIKTYFLDDNNNIVEEENATHIIVQELDEDGHLVTETTSIIRRPEEIKKIEEQTYEVDDDIKEILDNYTDSDGNYMFRKK